MCLARCSLRVSHFSLPTPAARHTRPDVAKRWAIVAQSSSQTKGGLEKCKISSEILHMRAGQFHIQTEAENAVSDALTEVASGRGVGSGTAIARRFVMSNSPNVFPVVKQRDEIPSSRNVG